MHLTTILHTVDVAVAQTNPRDSSCKTMFVRGSLLEIRRVATIEYKRIANPML